MNVDFSKSFRRAAITAALGAVATACQPADPPAPPDAPKAAAPAQVGEASFYGPGLLGKRTASGEPLRAQALTAASRTLPLGANAKVTNTQTGQSVVVEINDRGPYAEGRILDVSPKAADQLGMTDDGTATVVVQPLD